MSEVDLQEAERFLTALDEAAESFCFRVFDDTPDAPDSSKARKLDGPFDKLSGILAKSNANRCGVFVVVNEGGQRKEEIKRIRAVFADCDTAGAPYGPALDCGLDPHLVIESSPGKWHAYWFVDGLPIEAFEGVQRAIAAEFGTDDVHDLPRVMRLPGFNHGKGDPHLVRIIHSSSEQPHTAEAVLARFPPMRESPKQATESATVEMGRHASILKETRMLASDVARGHMSRDEALAVMRIRRDGGRYSRPVPDDEIVRALDGAINKEPAQEAPTTLAETLRTLTTSLTPAEIEEARKLWPHVFTFGETGAFPLGEVTIVGAPGREGKTTILVGLLARFALELPVGGMMPSPGVAVVLSAEDDRAQYARKLGAVLEGMTPAARAQVLERVKIPNLYDPSVRAYRRLVSVVDRQPAETAMVPALIEALGPLTDAPVPLRLLIVETASTWNDAGEDNPGQRAIVDACKQVAHALGVAVVLVHHTSQAAANNLPTLDIGANDIRGGTALTFNSRQNWLLVSLGEVDNPFPGTDARTVLREAIAPGDPHRIGALICLDSSKSDDPPPIFWRWERSPGFGPRAVEVQAPAEFAGKRWRKVHAMIRARKAEQRSEAKQAAADASVRHCVELVARLGEAGKPATARAVSVAAGRSAGWAAPYLSEAIAEGLLVSREELVPRVKGPVSVYFVPDSSEGDE